MTRFAVIADLHDDYWLNEGIDTLEGTDFSEVDAVFFAGDITNKGHIQWKYALERIGKHVDLNKVYMIPGNHDYYAGDVDRDDKLEAHCIAAGANFAQKREVIIGETRFLCATLWTDMRGDGSRCITDNYRKAEEVMQDHKRVRVAEQGYRKMSAATSARIHAEQRGWLAAKMAEPFDGQTIVITHHAPLMEASNTGFYEADHAYASDLSDLIEEGQPDRWYYGHTHYGLELQHGATLLKNCSLGYPPSIDPDNEVGDLSDFFFKTEDDDCQLAYTGLN